MSDYNKGGHAWDVTVARGDDITITWQVYDETGAAMDWSGATVVASIIGGAGGVSGWTVDTTVTGVLSVTLTDAQTQALTSQTFDQFLRVTKNSITSTWLAGQLKIHPVQEPVASRSTGHTIHAVTTVAGTIILDGCVGTIGSGGGGGAPTGAAGGVLSGTYPNPGFAVDMATQAELNTALAGKSDISHTQAATTVTVTPTGAVAATNVQTAIAELDSEKAPTSHTHAAADITSGVLSTARLGTGTADITKVLYGDGTWKVAPTGGGGGATIQEGMVSIPLSADEQSVLTTGTKWTKQWPFGLDVTDIKLNLAQPSTSGVVTVDIRNGNNVSIFSTLITVDVGERSSATAAVPYVLSTSALAEDGLYSAIITTPGTGALGAWLYVIGTRNDSNSPPVVTDTTLAWEGFDLGESGVAPTTSNTTADSVNGTPGTLFVSDLQSLEGGMSLQVIGTVAQDVRFEHPTHTTHNAKFYYHHKSVPGETAWLQYLYAADGTTLGNRFGINASGAFTAQVGTAGATDTANFSATTGKWYKIRQIAVGAGTTRWAIFDEANINNDGEVGASDVVIVTNAAASWSDERIGLLNTLAGGSSIPANLTDEGWNGANGTEVTVGTTSADAQGGTAATRTFTTAYAKEGTASFRVNGTLNGQMTFLNASHTFHGISFYMKFTTGPTGALGSAYLVNVKTADNAAVAFQIGINTSNQLTARNANNGTGANAVTLGTALVSGTEYRVEASATASGQFVLNLYTGANQDGTTPTQTGTMANALTAADFGRELVGLITDVTTAIDVAIDRYKTSDAGIPSPVGGGAGTPIEGFFEEYRSDSAVMPPNLNVVIDGGGGGGNTTVSSKLVPAVGAWWGAATPSSTSLGTDSTGLAEWIAAAGRRPDILHFYKTALNWTGPTSAERAMLEPSGQARAIPLYNWKFFNGTSPQAVANGSNDTNIVRLAQNLSAYPYQFMLTLAHEWDNDTPRNGSAPYMDSQYIAAWQHVVTLMKANNRGNIVFVWNQTGSANNAGSLSGQWWNVMYPGDTYVDWIAYDPYKQNNSGKLDFAGLVNHNVGNTANGYLGFYWWAQTYHPAKPVMMGEWGTWMTDANYTDAGACTPAEAAAWMNTIDDQIEDFPALKAMNHYNTKKEHDNRIQMPGREAVSTAITTIGNMAYLNVGTSNAP